MHTQTDTPESVLALRDVWQPLAFWAAAVLSGQGDQGMARIKLSAALDFARSALTAPPQPPAPEPSQGDVEAVRRAANALATAVRPEVLDRRSTVQVAQALAAWDALALPPTDAAPAEGGVE